MNKLQRYWADESGIYNLTTDDCEMGDTCRLVCKDADVSALEAENERLLAEVIKLNMWINEVTYCIRKFCEYLRAGTQYQTEKDYRIAAKIEAILNREQEKQP